MRRSAHEAGDAEGVKVSQQLEIESEWITLGLFCNCSSVVEEPRHTIWSSCGGLRNHHVSTVTRHLKAAASLMKEHLCRLIKEILPNVYDSFLICKCRHCFLILDRFGFRTWKEKRHMRSTEEEKGQKWIKRIRRRRIFVIIHFEKNIRMSRKQSKHQEEKRQNVQKNAEIMSTIFLDISATSVKYRKCLFSCDWTWSSSTLNKHDGEMQEQPSEETSNIKNLKRSHA